jgi:hypothetical protein
MVSLYNRNWSRAELQRRVGSMSQLAGIRLSELSDGKGRGCRVLDVWTGTGLRFQVNADRALDISACDYKGIPMCWRSQAGDVAPAFYEPKDLGWLRSFSGGMLATCGLNQFGSPSEENGTEIGLHGRISNLPASQVNYRTYWSSEDYILEISGEVRQAAVFGENLVIRRRITTKLGSNQISIHDEVTNEGFESTPHMLLYHFNVGFPVADETTQLTIDSKEVLARNEDAQKGIKNWAHFQAPTPGFQEQVFIHSPKANELGIARVDLNNLQIGLGLRWSYDTTNLPYLMEWKMMGEGLYVIGIEPSNCNGLGGQNATLKQGGLPFLQPGESRSYQLNLEVVSLDK